MGMLRASAVGLGLLACNSAMAQASVALDASGYGGANGGANCPGTLTVRENIATPLTYCYEITLSLIHI